MAEVGDVLVTDKKDVSAIAKTVVTAVMSAIAGAMLMMLLNARSMEVRMASAEKAIDEYGQRIGRLETGVARNDSRITILESRLEKLDDIWRVVVQRAPAGR